jgi:hypothetical protein
VVAMLREAGEFFVWIFINHLDFTCVAVRRRSLSASSRQR